MALHVPPCPHCAVYAVVGPPLYVCLMLHRVIAMRSVTLGSGEAISVQFLFDRTSSRITSKGRASSAPSETIMIAVAVMQVGLVSLTLPASVSTGASSAATPSPDVSDIQTVLRTTPPPCAARRAERPTSRPASFYRSSGVDLPSPAASPSARP